MNPASETFSIDVDALVRICRAAAAGDRSDLRRELIYLGVPILQRGYVEDELQESCYQHYSYWGRL